jgi:hypothetical protein
MSNRCDVWSTPLLPSLQVSKCGSLLKVMAGDNHLRRLGVQRFPANAATMVGAMIEHCFLHSSRNLRKTNHSRRSQNSTTSNTRTMLRPSCIQNPSCTNMGRDSRCTHSRSGPFWRRRSRRTSRTPAVHGCSGVLQSPKRAGVTITSAIKKDKTYSHVGPLSSAAVRSQTARSLRISPPSVFASTHSVPPERI